MATSLKSEHQSPGRRGRLRPGTKADAIELGLDVSGLNVDGVAAAVKAERIKRFKEENRDYFAAWNEWIEENGLPLERYRMF